jgi:sulfate adenylyltransferase
VTGPTPSLPQFAPSQREIDDVELLRMGVLAPLHGFHAAGGSVTLQAPHEVVDWAEARGGLEIVDAEGVPLAEVRIEDRYRVDAETSGIVGDVVARPGLVSRAFRDLYMPPSGSRAFLPASTVTVAVDRALTETDLAEIAAQAGSEPVLFVVLTGDGTPRELSAHGLVKATLAAAQRFPTRQVVAVPAARRPDPADDEKFRERVVAAYAPGPTVLWPSGDGALAADIDELVRLDRPRGTDRGVVVFFTGLSGSGKSTIAQGLRDRLLETGSRTVSLLDGDRVRKNLSRGLTFSRQDREINLERIAWVAAEVARHRGFAICSPIAPYDVTRKVARQLTEDAGGVFVLVHVATPLAECERRDRKGLYARARRGEIEMFTGISSPYEEPADAELTIDTTGLGEDEALNRVLSYLVGRELLPASLLA